METNAAVQADDRLRFSKKKRFAVPAAAVRWRERRQMSEVVMAASSRMVCRVAFGKRYEEGGPGMKRFYQILKGFDNLTTSFFVSDYFPALSFVDKMSGRMNSADAVCKVMDSFYQELIDEHRESRRIM
ncbi:hypothetical protein SASPL_113864 [Salvia splendens]|uniref:Uncharacterized protein n=1 Tax=Salvia splendens TaxID=180675 RepID=A0A8X8Y4V4_SALSN|nr:hypothetical protein SASPL_113864 [Salvia splendens]